MKDRLYTHIKFSIWMVVFLVGVPLSAQKPACATKLDNFNRTEDIPPTKLAEYRNCVKTLENSLKESTKIDANIKTLKAELKTKIAGVTALEKSSDLEPLRKEVAALEKNKTKLADQLKTKKNKAKDLGESDDGKKAKKEVEKLESDIKKLDDQLKTKKAKIAALENSKDVENLQKEVTQINGEIKKMEDQRKVVNGSIVTLGKSYDKLITYFDEQDEMDTAEEYEKKKTDLNKYKN